MSPRAGPRRKPAHHRLRPALLVIAAFGVALLWRSCDVDIETDLPTDTPRRHLAALAGQQAALFTDGGSSDWGSSWGLRDEPSPPKYSTQTCVGPKPDDQWQMATCKFDNVCLNASTAQLEYYVSPDYPEHPVAFDQGGNPMEQFSEHLLHPGHYYPNKSMGWRPVVKRRPFPAGPRVVWAPAAQALLQAYSQRFVLNFGHAMYDSLVPLFNMQHLFGIYTPDAQPLILGAMDSTEQLLWSKMEPMLQSPGHPEKSLLRLTWDHDIQFTRNYTQQILGDGGDGLVCFKTVLAGTGYLSRRLSRLNALPYRQAVMGRLGLREAPQEVPVITVFKKEGRRIIENTDEIYALLRARYPAARVQMFTFGPNFNETMAWQIKLMSETSILLSPCGGVATVLAFMQPGATAIVMNYWHSLRNRSVNMEDQFYRYINYLDIQYFPVTLDDYDGTGDRPDCELKNSTLFADHRFPDTGAFVNCNLRFRGAGLARLVAYVDAALLRWAARTGQYEAVETMQRDVSIPQQVQEEPARVAAAEQQQQQLGALAVEQEQQQQLVAAQTAEQQPQQLGALAVDQQQQLGAVTVEQQQLIALTATQQQQQLGALAVDQQQQLAAVTVEQQQLGAITAEQQQQLAALAAEQQQLGAQMAQEQTAQVQVAQDADAQAAQDAAAQAHAANEAAAQAQAAHKAAMQEHAAEDAAAQAQAAREAAVQAQAAQEAAAQAQAANQGLQEQQRLAAQT